MQLTPAILEPPVVLSNDPPPPPALAEGLRRHQDGQLEGAERIYRNFLRDNPEHPQALAFMGTLAAQQGNFQVATELLSKAIQRNPALADPRYCRGRILAIHGQLSQAVTPFSFATALGHPKAGEELESLLTQLGPQDRVQSYRIRANSHYSRNQLELALQCIRDAIRTNPEDISNWLIFTQFLAHIRFTRRVEPDLLADIRDAFEIKELDHKHIAGAAISALMHGDSIATLRTAFAQDGDPIDYLRRGLAEGALRPLTEDSLFRKILERSLVNSPEFEHLLTGLRTAILLEYIGNTDHQPKLLGLISSLSQQCFLNEYIWTTTAEEGEVVRQLVGEIKGLAENNKPVPAATLAIVGAYQPLHRLPCAMWLQTQAWPEALAGTIRLQLDEPLQEQRLRTQIPSVLPVADDESEQLRLQYEESPYPRWINLPIQGDPISLEKYISRIFPTLTEAERRQPDNPQILVAGCGTGLAPNHLAQHIKNASVVALDLSLNSLAYAQRKSCELSLDNVEYMQGDILNLGMLGRQFDHINCYGVLHHLKDIQKAWRALADCLTPNGTMQIGIYGEIAQRPLEHARLFIDQGSYGSSLDDIRKCRQDMIAQKDDTLILRLTESPSFFNMSDFRDLIFHYKKRFVTMVQLRNMIAELGLQFIGFQHSDPSINQRYLHRFPQDPAMCSLELWEQFEAEHPETFSSFYNFWVRKPN